MNGKRNHGGKQNRILLERMATLWVKWEKFIEFSDRPPTNECEMENRKK